MHTLTLLQMYMIPRVYHLYLIRIFEKPHSHILVLDIT